MSTVERPFINGHFPDWSSCEFKFKGVIYSLIKSINYSDKFDSVMVNGNHPEPVGETRGVYKAESSVEFYIDEFKRIVQDLGVGWREQRFLVTCSYRDGEQAVTTDQLIGVRLRDVDASQSQGTDPLVRKLGLSILKIKWSGVENLTIPLSGQNA